MCHLGAGISAKSCLFYFTILPVLYVLTSSASWAQNSFLFKTDGSRLMTPKYGYLHVGVGGGLSVAQSEDIETVTDPFEIYPVAFDRFFNVSLGFKNIFQLEYRKNQSNHDSFYADERISNGTITNEVIEIGMTQRFSEWLFKFNPLFATTDRGLAVFLEYGVGNVEN
ncbi:MAG: hypothetical protein EHM72_14885, partial [Calditrichaeota bacterium]